MRVKISYTVELEEIPQKISALVTEAAQELLHATEDGMGEFKQLLLEDGNLPRAIERVGELRKSLMKADVQLSDCVQLLVDLQVTLAQLSTSTSEVPQEQQTEQGEEATDEQG